MSNMIEVEVAELEGEALDWAVGKAVGEDVVIHPLTKKAFWNSGPDSVDGPPRFRPSTNWLQGGPLIDRFDVGFIRFGNSIVATTDSSDFDYSGFLGGEMHGPNRLIAAMRAIVAAEMGDAVQVPSELMEAS